MGGSTGSWETRWRPHAWERIDYFLKIGVIAEGRVRELAKEAFTPRDQALARSMERLNQIGAAVGATVEGGQGKLGDILFYIGGEQLLPNSQFGLCVRWPDARTGKMFSTTADAVEWLKTLAAPPSHGGGVPPEPSETDGQSFHA
jgi:hypothetical protein